MEAWRDHTSLARRQHIHGKLRGLAEDARAIGEPSIPKAAVCGSLFLIAGVLALVAFA